MSLLDKIKIVVSDQLPEGVVLLVPEEEIRNLTENTKEHNPDRFNPKACGKIQLEVKQ